MGFQHYSRLVSHPATLTCSWYTWSPACYSRWWWDIPVSYVSSSATIYLDTPRFPGGRAEASPGGSQAPSFETAPNPHLVRHSAARWNTSSANCRFLQKDNEAPLDSTPCLTYLAKIPMSFEKCPSFHLIDNSPPPFFCIICRTSKKSYYVKFYQLQFTLIRKWDKDVSCSSKAGVATDTQEDRRVTWSLMCRAEVQKTSH